MNSGIHLWAQHHLLAKKVDDEKVISIRLLESHSTLLFSHQIPYSSEQVVDVPSNKLGQIPEPLFRMQYALLEAIIKSCRDRLTCIINLKLRHTEGGDYIKNKFITNSTSMLGRQWVLELSCLVHTHIATKNQNHCILRNNPEIVK